MTGNRRKMTKRLATYIIRRLLFLIPTFFGSSIIIFFVMNAAGNPVYLMVAQNPGVSVELCIATAVGLTILGLEVQEERVYIHNP